MHLNALEKLVAKKKVILYYRPTNQDDDQGAPSPCY